MSEDHNAMKRLWRHVRCALFGHPDTVIVWGPWIDNFELGRHRVVTKRCRRCDGVLALRSVVEGERWTA
jgi:hypothetical protein